MPAISLNRIKEQMKKHEDFTSVKASRHGVDFTYARRRLTIREEDGNWYVHSGNYRLYNLGPKGISLKKIADEMFFITSNWDQFMQARY